MMLDPTERMRLPSIAWERSRYLLAAAVILTALAFERFGGYVACPLCLQERWAY